MEETLKRFQRLESLGQLTGEVAHDFNNILCAITANLPSLERTAKQDASSAQALLNTREALEIGGALTQRLLAFARKQILRPEIVELNQLVRSASELIAISLGNDIKLDVALSPQPLHAQIDPGQLESALLNLCLNGAQAIKRTGTVSIQVYSEMPDYVCVQVKDDGSGMEPEVLERALEPFFSTKRETRGSGLGLSIVYGFIKQSAGDLQIASIPGVGTTVTMKLRCWSRSLHEPQRPYIHKSRRVQAV